MGMGKSIKARYARSTSGSLKSGECGNYDRVSI